MPYPRPSANTPFAPPLTRPYPTKSRVGLFFIWLVMSYAVIADLTARYDSRTLAQQSNDTNSASASTTNQQAALDDATAEINTAVLQGSIYTLDQLTALLLTGDTQLIRLCCDTAVKFLCSRRMDSLPASVTDRIKASEFMLESLRSGKRVLNVVINRQADVPILLTNTTLQQQNLGDITATDFFVGLAGTNTVDGPSG